MADTTLSAPPASQDEVALLDQLAHLRARRAARAIDDLAYRHEAHRMLQAHRLHAVAATA
ncbi:MAG: hypothetical protein AB7H43_07970 [Acidimicrobiia bacterium]